MPEQEQRRENRPPREGGRGPGDGGRGADRGGRRDDRRDDRHAGIADAPKGRPRSSWKN